MSEKKAMFQEAIQVPCEKRVQLIESQGYKVTDKAVVSSITGPNGTTPVEYLYTFVLR